MLNVPKSFKNLPIILILTLPAIFLFQCHSLPGSIKLKFENPLDIPRINETIVINREYLRENYNSFDFSSFSVFEGKNRIPAEAVMNKISNENEIIILVDFQPGEIKEITIVDSSSAASTVKKTKAYLGEKKDYVLKEGYYTGGYFSEVKSTKVPPDHFAHDALYQFEGPGWESEKTGYRLYLDDRNRTDIFGKRKPDLITDKIGKNDLVSDGRESYQKMQDWGQDIFKVGTSLGIGSAAAFIDTVITISRSDSIVCETFNNNLTSGVKTIHYGWNTGEKKTDAAVIYSINAGSRFTRVNIKTGNEIPHFCTGLAKHAGTEFLQKENEKWGYIALWGKQTTAGDNLGIAVFYNKINLFKTGEDQLNYLVIFNPGKNEAEYFFCAAWEQEKDGIKTKEEFISFLDEELKKFANPVKIFLNAN